MCNLSVVLCVGGEESDWSSDELLLAWNNFQAPECIQVKEFNLVNQVNSRQVSPPFGRIFKKEEGDICRIFFTYFFEKIFFEVCCMWENFW